MDDPFEFPTTPNPRATAGLMCMTSEVDVNVLAQCFELTPYDNLLKPAYWAKVYQQMQIEIYGDVADTRVYSRGTSHHSREQMQAEMPTSAKK